MSPLEAVALALAAFGAGAVNAVAGGGSLISFPSLVAVGYTAKVANVTNTVSLLPGYLGGSLAYRAELSRQGRNLRLAFAPTLVGAIAGAVILLSTPESTFDTIVPFLILGACLLLAAQDRLTLILTPGAHAAVEPSLLRAVVLQLGLFGAAVYGAYFGAGLGIIILAVLGVLLPDDLHRSNALKGLLSLFINCLAAGYFALFADVVWSAAAVMALAALGRGYLGVAVARRFPREWLRRFVIAYGVVAALVLLAT